MNTLVDLSFYDNLIAERDAPSWSRRKQIVDWYHPSNGHFCCSHPSITQAAKFGCVRRSSFREGPVHAGGLIGILRAGDDPIMQIDVSAYPRPESHVTNPIRIAVPTLEELQLSITLRNASVPFCVIGRRWGRAGFTTSRGLSFTGPNKTISDRVRHTLEAFEKGHLTPEPSVV